KQLFVGASVGVLPEALGGRGFQYLFDAARSGLAHQPGEWAGELLRSAGQLAFEFLFEIHVLVELFDEEVGERRADLRVVDQLVARMDPVVGVEDLAFDPDREDAEKGENRADRDERFDGPSTATAHGGMLYVTQSIEGDRSMNLEGIHHITEITADAQDNVDFYAGVLGLRLVKKTVNQDQPTVYHLFFADEKGSAGSDLTFFEFPGVPSGRAGAGEVHRIVWRVGPEAPDFWAKRLAQNGIESQREGES